MFKPILRDFFAVGIPCSSVNTQMIALKFVKTSTNRLSWENTFKHFWKILHEILWKGGKQLCLVQQIRSRSLSVVCQLRVLDFCSKGLLGG